MPTSPKVDQARSIILRMHGVGLAEQANNLLLRMRCVSEILLQLDHDVLEPSTVAVYVVVPRTTPEVAGLPSQFSKLRCQRRNPF